MDGSRVKGRREGGTGREKRKGWEGLVEEWSGINGGGRGRRWQ
jgi:hypothetical protein